MSYDPAFERFWNGNASTVRPEKEEPFSHVEEEGEEWAAFREAIQKAALKKIIEK